jgi:hypothetical protein
MKAARIGEPFCKKVPQALPKTFNTGLSHGFSRKNHDSGECWKIPAKRLGETLLIRRVSPILLL